MNPLNFKADKIVQELLDFNGKMIKGLENLSTIGQVNVGSSPHQVIHSEDKTNLRYYPPSSNEAQHEPLLIVYALVNRPYILDLQPGRSLIEALNSRGVPIYLIDWGYPDQADRYLSLDDYINGYLHNCVSATLAHSDRQQINMLGVCQGGTFSLCYSAIYTDRIANLVTMVTPVDFHTPDNTLAKLTKHLDIELAIDSFGNVPGQLLAQAYNALMPMRLGLQKQLDLPMQLQQREGAQNFLRMEQWINDSPDLAGRALKEFLDAFFVANHFVQGGLNIGDHAVALTNIQQPILNLFARNDHLVPPSASKALKGLTSSKDYNEVEIGGGHIGIFVGRHAQKRVPDLIDKWLYDRRPSA